MSLFIYLHKEIPYYPNTTQRYPILNKRNALGTITCSIKLKNMKTVLLFDEILCKYF